MVGAGDPDDGGAVMTIDTGDPKQLTRILGRSRLVLGLSLAIAPRLAGPIMGVSARTSSARLFARVAGVRDAVLGAGMEMSVREDRFPQAWVGMAALADLGDAVVHLLTRGLGRRARLTSLMASGSAALHLQLARQLDELSRAAVEPD
jgi:hypothetical protein